MLFSLPIFILIITASVLLVIQRIRRQFKYLWLLAFIGALLSVVGVILWQVNFPSSVSLPAWKPVTVFHYSPTWFVDGVSWPYSLSLVVLAAAIILTSSARGENDPLPWIGTLFLTALGILAVSAGDPLTLVLAWTALDLAELITMLRSTEGKGQNQAVIVAFTMRVIGTGLVIWASAINSTPYLPMTFDRISTNAGIYLLIASGLRLGVLPLHLPYRNDNVVRRGFGTCLRLVAASASLSLLARIPTGALDFPWTPYLLAFTALPAIYAGWMWLRASDEILGRPFWLLGMASLAVASTLRINQVGSIGLGVVLIVCGGLIFLYTSRHRSVLWLPILGLWAVSAIPFSPSAAAWSSGNDSSWLLLLPFLVAQALLMAGFIRHALHPGETSFESQERWARILYPAGLFLLLGVSILLGLWGWEGAMEIGLWWASIPVILLAMGIISLSYRALAQTPGSISRWGEFIRPGALIKIMNQIIRFIEGFVHTITTTLEGEGGNLLVHLVIGAHSLSSFIGSWSMSTLNWIAFGIIIIASVGILLVRDWRWNLGLLAAQYLGFFWLIQSSWTISLSAGKLVTGWMVCAVLGIAHLNISEDGMDEGSWPQGRLFRLAVIGLILIVSLAGAVGLQDWLGMLLPAAWGGLLLIGMGVLLTGITLQPFRIIVGLLSILSGFEIIYAAVESSSLVTGLLALVNLGLALTGAYFLSHQGEKVEP